MTTTPTYQGLLERAICAVKQSLRNLTAKEETEITEALVRQELSGSTHRDGCEEMRAVVVGSNLKWPAFEDWFRRFKEADTWPSMWEIDGDDEIGPSRAD